MCLVTQLYPTIHYPMDCSPPGSSIRGDSPGKNTRIGCHAVPQRIFPTQGSNPGLLYCRRILYHLSHQRSARILKWGAHPFSRRSSGPRNWTRVSCIAGRFFTNWVIREDLYMVVCICQSQFPNLSCLSFPPSNYKFVFYICDSISVL